MKIKFIFYLGLDISKATFHYRLDDARGEALASGQLPNQKEGFAALLEALQAAGVSDFRAVHAAMEATGRYGLALWHALVAAALPVSVLNPARVKAFGRTLGRRSKNDSGDAALLAAFARIHQPHLVWPDSPAIASLKELTGEIHPPAVGRFCETPPAQRLAQGTRGWVLARSGIGPPPHRGGLQSGHRQDFHPPAVGRFCETPPAQRRIAPMNNLSTLSVPV
jgi:transposase